jgi:LPS export ABC transporter protein LptC
MMMYSQAKKLLHLYLPAVFICMLLASCENSLNDIQKIASAEADKPISRSTFVDIIYSDSAKVKAHLTAPLEIDYEDAAKPYKEMSKGVKIIFYEDDLSVKGTITSEYAIEKDKENLIEFHKNVVAKNAQGETFMSDELIYDEANKKLFSKKPVQIIMTNGNVMNGTGFNSNESLYPWHIDQSTGVFHVNDKDSGINP